MGVIVLEKQAALIMRISSLLGKCINLLHEKVWLP